MKKNKTSNRQKAGYKRKDLRKGGRVKHARGDEVTDNNYTQAIDQKQNEQLNYQQKKKLLKQKQQQMQRLQKKLLS